MSQVYLSDNALAANRAIVLVDILNLEELNLVRLQPFYLEQAILQHGIVQLNKEVCVLSPRRVENEE